MGRSYTFVDAIAKFGQKLKQKDLSTAYVRAGNTFDGALSQYFIVLVDDHDGQRTRSGANRSTIGRRGGRSSRGRVARGGPVSNFLRMAHHVESDDQISTDDGDVTLTESTGLTDRGTKRPADVDEPDDESTKPGSSKRQEKEKEPEVDSQMFD